MAYTNDLVRLAASMKIVIDAEGLSIKMKVGCDAILEGYSESLRKGGRPIVLEEHEQKLGKVHQCCIQRFPLSPGPRREFASSIRTQRSHV
jgi:uncharacterized protein (DUF2252 family)